MPIIHAHSRAAKTLAAVLVAATILACKAQPVPDSNRDPADRVADPENSRTVVIKVTKATGPYDIWVRANDAGTDRGDWSKDRQVSPGYQQTLTYTSGLRIEVMVTVFGHGGDTFGCEIRDGEHKDAQERKGRVQCFLTTSR